MDPRREALKAGIRQLRKYEIERLIAHVEAGQPVLLDRDEQGRANYSNNTYCPLAVAVGARLESDEKVARFLIEECGFKIYNTRGVVGEFYTTNRSEDLLTAAREVLEERS